MVPLTVGAQQQLTGRFEHVGSTAENAARQTAIDSGIANIPRFLRSRARERIQDRTDPANFVEILLSGDRLHLRRDNRSLHLTVNGPTIEVETDHGPRKVRAKHRDNGLEISTESSEGSMVTTYQLPGDGQVLIVHVELRSRNLAKPIRYQITYGRV
ncbi:MAG: hypothetical protein AAF550_12125 [Myxococcota bacterium]